MNKYKTINQSVLSKITPSDDYKKKVDTTLQKIKKKIKDEIQKRNIPATIELVGSIAKDTYLRDNLDMDIFLVFPRTVEKKIIAQETLSLGKTILLETEECYAEHPYIRGIYEGFKVELVPCYHIINAADRITAVDRTPLHTQYVISHLKENQKQEVRLFKQFLYGIGCYGAEANVQGFSGYLCELLIIKYNTFEELLADAAAWVKPIRYSLLTEEIPSFSDPFIFIDPVDPERNVASAVSIETFQYFIHACQTYLKNPSITFFFPNPLEKWTLDRIKKNLIESKSQYVGIQFPKPDIINENLIPQLRKACRNVTQTCTQYGFIINDIQFSIDETNKQVYIILKADVKPISSTYTHIGPPTTQKNHVQDFLEKWKNNPEATSEPYQKNNRIYVEVARKWLTLESFLLDNIHSIRLGKHLDKISINLIKILPAKDLIITPLQEFWTKYLDNKNSWER